MIPWSKRLPSGGSNAETWLIERVICSLGVLLGRSQLIEIICCADLSGLLATTTWRLRKNLIIRDHHLHASLIWSGSLWALHWVQDWLLHRFLLDLLKLTIECVASLDYNHRLVWVFTTVLAELVAILDSHKDLLLLLFLDFFIGICCARTELVYIRWKINATDGILTSCIPDLLQTNVLNPSSAHIILDIIILWSSSL
jgi:hypothetical protein